MSESVKNHQDKRLEIDNLPNRLTIFRVVLVPVVVMCLAVQTTQLFLPYHNTLGWVAGWVFTAAAITDFFDGYIARKKDIVTIFGSFLDPIADKFLVVSSLIMLGELKRIPVLIVVILVLREIYMTSLRLLATSEGLSVPVNSTGKWKTALQMIGIPMLMANGPFFGIPFPIIGTLSIYISCLLSFSSALIYSLSFLKKIKQSQMEKKKLAKDQA